MTFQFLPVPVANRTYKNVNGSELTDENLSFVNGYITERNGVAIRPNLYEIAGSISAEPTGAFYWPNKNLILKADRFGRVFAIPADVPGVGIELTSISARLLANNICYFALSWDGNYCYIANGGQILKTDGTTVGGATILTDPNAPTNAKQIASIDGYILAITGSDNKFYFSNPLDGDTWDAIDFASAVRNPDNIIALRIYENDIYLLGKKSVEIWRNDGVTPFSPISGGYIERGCSAPDSPISTESGIYWIDEFGYPAKFTGQNLERLAFDYNLDIKRNLNYTSCITSRLDYAGKSFLSFFFPDEDKSYIYDTLNGFWYDWKIHTGVKGEETVPFFSKFAVNCPGQLFPIGDKYAESSTVVVSWQDPSDHYDNGNLYVLNSTTDDYGDQQSANFNNRLEVITGHLDWGVPDKKRARKLSVRLQSEVDSGIIDTPEQYQLVVKVNDDNRGWSNEFNIPLVRTGQDIVASINLQGIFETRQYSFSCSGSLSRNFSFSRVVQEIEVL